MSTAITVDLLGGSWQSFNTVSMRPGVGASHDFCHGVSTVTSSRLFSACTQLFVHASWYAGHMRLACLFTGVAVLRA